MSHRAGVDVTSPTSRLDASMTLLREVMERPLDPGYAQAAARARPRTLRRVAVTALLAVVAGFVVAVAVLEVRLPRTEALSATDRLRQEIERRTAEVQEAEAANARARAAISAAEQAALASAGGSALLERRTRLGLVTGELAVTGPGLRFTVDDAPGSRPDTGIGTDPRVDPSASAGIVYDSDLQIIVNGLWAAGAEAIAINGHRLTSLSAIRLAGEAILVDFRPLVPPYVVEAIGDPSRLQAGFASGAAGPYVQSMRDNDGISVGIAAQDDLDLPAAGQLVLRAARAALPSGTPSPGATP